MVFLSLHTLLTMHGHRNLERASLRCHPYGSKNSELSWEYTSDLRNRNILFGLDLRQFWLKMWHPKSRSAIRNLSK